jgi:hypothetical protein
MSSSNRSGIVRVLAIILAVIMFGSIISGLFYAIAAGI